MKIDITDLTYAELKSIIEKMRIEKLELFIEKAGSAPTLSAICATNAANFVQPPQLG